MGRDYSPKGEIRKEKFRTRAQLACPSRPCNPLVAALGGQTAVPAMGLPAPLLQGEDRARAAPSPLGAAAEVHTSRFSLTRAEKGVRLFLHPAAACLREDACRSRGRRRMPRSQPRGIGTSGPLDEGIQKAARRNYGCFSHHHMRLNAPVRATRRLDDKGRHTPCCCCCGCAAPVLPVQEDDSCLSFDARWPLRLPHHTGLSLCCTARSASRGTVAA